MIGRISRIASFIALVWASGGCAWVHTHLPASNAGAAPANADVELRRLASSIAECNPVPDAKQAQHVVGYGSLMQDESRKRTTPSAGPAAPVLVQGARRGWFARGDGIGFETTYLGAVADPKGKLNAVVYRVSAAELKATDEREAFYCRHALDASALTMLEGTDAPAPRGQLWIYLNKPAGIATPSPKYPIVQSYVDIFVSGCLEQEERHHVAGFARQCLATTTDWSTFWVSDRIYPRRPFIFEPRARQIDALLSEQLPRYFQAIRIESGYTSASLAKVAKP